MPFENEFKNSTLVAQIKNFNRFISDSANGLLESSKLYYAFPVKIVLARDANVLVFQL